ncbi:MAG: TolC family protein [Bacteroidota bacterium]
MNKLFFSIILLTMSLYATAQEKFNLPDIIERAKSMSPRAKQAETRKENLYWQYRLFKSNYNPQLVLSGNLPGITRAVEAINQPQGGSIFINNQASLSDLSLGFSQPITLTGGEISVNSGIGRSTFTIPDASGEDVFSKTWSSNVFNIRLVQPIFGFNDLKWDKKIEPLRYEESKKGFVEDMELISRTAVELYFDYLGAQVDLQVAEFNLSNNDTIYNIEKGRYNIGTTSKDKLLQVELQFLQSKQQVASANLALQTARLGLNSFTGLSVEQYVLDLPEETPEFDINLDKALQYARANRSDYVEFSRRRMEADREVARAKAQRFQVNLIASFGQNGGDSTFVSAYETLSDRQTANITLSVPILTWGRNEARLKTALANKQLTDYTLTQDEQNFDQEVITLVSRIDVLRIQLDIAKKSDEVAQERYQVAQNRYLIGKIDITNLNIALEQKDSSKRSYVRALRDFWTAYYDLRRLTLYDFLNNQLLYREE